MEKIVIKVGSSIITEGENHLNYHLIKDVARQASILFKEGTQVAIVTSGAVACGRSLIGERNGGIVGKQVAAAFGQPLLFNRWGQALDQHQVLASMFLLSEVHLEKPKWPLLDALELGVAVINANDAVDDYEMKQVAISADNDRLAAHIADLIGAQKLIYLTDTHGVKYNLNDPEIISNINSLAQIKKINFGPRSTKGTGGMKSKVNSGWDFAIKGRQAVIASAWEEGVILRFVQGARLGTLISR